MVRRKVEIKKIENKSKRQTTFTKRRQGLFKKANEYCKKSGAEIAIITFSMAGNGFAFGNPSVESVISRYVASDQRQSRSREATVSSRGHVNTNQNQGVEEGETINSHSDDQSGNNIMLLQNSQEFDDEALMAKNLNEHDEREASSEPENSHEFDNEQSGEESDEEEDELSEGKR